jgi:TonB family protein
MRTPTLSKLSMTLVVGVMFCVQNHANAQPNWQRFRVVKEGFSVLLPKLPTVVSRGQYGTTPVRDARIYAAYHDGVGYFVIYFDNPKNEHQLEYFFDEQLAKNELRNTEIVTKTGTIEARFPGVQYSFKKYDYRKTFDYPGVARFYAAKNRTLALLAIGKGESDASVSEFLRSLELSDKPAGTDIGNGGSNSSDTKEDTDLPVVPVTEVSRKAMILIKPAPHYTEDARQKKLRGNVVLRAVLSVSGKLTNIQVVSGVPELAQSSIDAAGKMFFIPAVKDGRFVSTPVELQYNFNIY